MTEATPEDRAEQAAAGTEDGTAGMPTAVPLEADPADAVEQAIAVPLDEDERR